MTSPAHKDSLSSNLGVFDALTPRAPGPTHAEPDRPQTGSSRRGFWDGRTIPVPGRTCTSLGSACFYLPLFVAALVLLWGWL